MVHAQRTLKYMWMTKAASRVTPQVFLGGHNKLHFGCGVQILLAAYLSKKKRCRDTQIRRTCRSALENQDKMLSVVRVFPQ
jgi:hypothetical protein